MPHQALAWYEFGPWWQLKTLTLGFQSCHSKCTEGPQCCLPLLPLYLAHYLSSQSSVPVLSPPRIFSWNESELDVLPLGSQSHLWPFQQQWPHCPLPDTCWLDSIRPRLPCWKWRSYCLPRTSSSLFLKVTVATSPSFNCCLVAP